MSTSQESVERNTNVNGNRSETAKIRHQIELECQAMRQALYGLAIVADHDTIAHKYQTLDTYHMQLTQLVGEEKATELICQTYTDILM